MTPTELIDSIPQWRERFEPDEMRIEKEKYSITIADMFKHRYPYLKIPYVEHHNRNKDSRIWRLRQWFQSKSILFGPDMDDLETLAMRWKGEGSIKYDCELDALAYQLDVKKPPHIPEPHRLPSGRIFEPNIDESFDRELEKILEVTKRQENEETRYGDAFY